MFFFDDSTRCSTLEGRYRVKSKGNLRACREMHPMTAHEDFKEQVAGLHNSKLRRSCGAGSITDTVTTGPEKAGEKLGSEKEEASNQVSLRSTESEYEL